MHVVRRSIIGITAALAMLSIAIPFFAQDATAPAAGKGGKGGGKAAAPAKPIRPVEPAPRGPDGRQHPKPEDLRPTSLGHSIGHWEADTLIVDTVGFNEKIWIMGSYPTTEQLHLTERFTRPTLGSLEYEVTIDDPGAYTAPWG